MLIVVILFEADDGISFTCWFKYFDSIFLSLWKYKFWIFLKIAFIFGRRLNREKHYNPHADTLTFTRGYGVMISGLFKVMRRQAYKAVVCFTYWQSYCLVILVILVILVHFGQLVVSLVQVYFGDWIQASYFLIEISAQQNV